MTLQEGALSEHRRARFLRGCLLAIVVVSAAAILSGLLQHNLISQAAAGGVITDAQASANDTRVQVIGIIQFLLWLVTAVSWLVWFRRAYGNLQVMGSGKSDHSPGWSVGWWFVPIANLFRPYQLTKEVWLRSAVGNTEASVVGVQPPSLLGAWWGVYIISGLVGRMLLRAAQEASQIEQLQRVTTIGILVDAAVIVSAVLAVSVVMGIDQFQQAAALRATAEPVPIDA